MPDFVTVSVGINQRFRDIRVASQAEADALRDYIEETTKALQGAGATVNLRCPDGTYQSVKVASVGDANAIAAFIEADRINASATAQSVNLIDPDGKATPIRVASAADAKALQAYVNRVAARVSVRVENKVEPVPVLMPARKTETTVQRDRNGDIVKTSSVERDA